MRKWLRKKLSRLLYPDPPQYSMEDIKKMCQSMRLTPGFTDSLEGGIYEKVVTYNVLARFDNMSQTVRVHEPYKEEQVKEQLRQLHNWWLVVQGK